MKSAQTTPMFMPLNEIEEANLSGGQSLVLSNQVISGKIIIKKGSSGKAGRKNVKVQVTRTLEEGEIAELEELDDLLSLLESEWE
ncbi:MAG: hypothetical protein KME32_19810 [Mojavia pulchra JT2-VF2]|jgi:hypothetical protein|uniref:Uncharacterized protein n=1 Tax=Mojavia pulchra JT2-VF2 TaxID=287848 RepID=A0A951Q134_9NOST|nr:hypothetical protein [Mojavia pulchra JT2-VF2]